MGEDLLKFSVWKDLTVEEPEGHTQFPGNRNYSSDIPDNIIT